MIGWDARFRDHGNHGNHSLVDSGSLICADRSERTVKTTKPSGLPVYQNLGRSDMGRVSNAFEFDAHP